MDEKTTTNWQNPFNLIDQDIAIAENTAQNNGTANTVANNNVETTNNATQTNWWEAPATNGNTNPPKEDIFDKIIWKFVSFLAKVSGQPDPTTWKTATSTPVENNQNNETSDQNTTATQPEKIDFNSVMSGVSWFVDKVSQTKVLSNVTGFLDKVWNKIEETTWINLNSTAWNTENTVQNPVQTQTTTQTVEPVQPVQTTQPETPVQPVESVQTVQPEAVAQPTEPTVQPQTPVQQ